MPPVQFHADVDVIFRQNHAWLRSRLMRHVSSHSDAEDVASETFLQLAQYSAPSQILEPRAFLSTLAKRILMEAICQIDRAIAALPLPVKTAFLLSRLDGLSYPQIAAYMGISLATVERHMKRALLQCVSCTTA